MIGVRDGERKRITERRCSFSERDAVLLEVAFGFPSIPIEVHSLGHRSTECIERGAVELRRRARNRGPVPSKRLTIPGPEPLEAVHSEVSAPVAVAVIAAPHPLMGGSLDVPVVEAL